MSIVEVNEEEAQTASFLAGMRYKSNRASDTENDRRGPQSDEKTDMNGVLAELAAAKYFNVWPHGMFTRGGADIYLPSIDMSVDVKATEYKEGHLISTIEKRYKDYADIFMLAIIDNGDLIRVDLAGWMLAENLLRDDMEDHFGHGFVYAASQDELNDVELLYDKTT